MCLSFILNSFFNACLFELACLSLLVCACLFVLACLSFDIFILDFIFMKTRVILINPLRLVFTKKSYIKSHTCLEYSYDLLASISIPHTFNLARVSTKFNPFTHHVKKNVWHFLVKRNPSNL